MLSLLKRITTWNIVKLGILSLTLSNFGGLLNAIVVDHNRGMMPVLVVNDEVGSTLGSDPYHTNLTQNSKYIVLSDIFPILRADEYGIEIEGIASIGDCFIFTGRSLQFAVWLSLILLPFVWAGKLIAKVFHRWQRKRGVGCLGYSQGYETYTPGPKPLDMW